MTKYFIYKILIFILFISSCAINTNIDHNPPKVIEGKITLTDSDLHGYTPIRLDGEWGFYWKELLISESIKNRQSKFNTVPGQWKDNDLSTSWQSGHGYATYRVLVEGLPQKTMYALKLPQIHSAYNVFINNELIKKSGIVGIDENSIVPKWSVDTIFFETNTDSTEILIQTSNFHNYRGGIISSIYLGTVNQIDNMTKKREYLELFIFGSILIMAFYHIGSFLFRKEDRSSLYFGIFCILINIRLMVTGESFLTTIFPDLPYEVVYKMVLSHYLAAPVFYMYMNSLYKNDFSIIVVRITQIFGLMFYIFALFAPSKFSSHTLPYEIIILFSILYCFYVLILACKKREVGAKTFFTGFLFLFITSVNDILYSNSIIQSGYLFPLGLFVFIFFQSLIISIRLSKSFTLIETLSNDLTLKVKEREEQLSKIQSLTKVFGYFVPQKMLNCIGVDDLEKISLGTSATECVTILFSDIRSYTRLTEPMIPGDVLDFLNSYFNSMNKSIHKYDGIIDKFVGDAIMAIFIDSQCDKKNEAERAILSAISMITMLKNDKRFNSENSHLDIGVGIHTGDAVLGTIGSKDRMDTTVVGDNVNLASRLEALTKTYGVNIITSYDTIKMVSDDTYLKYRELDLVKVKGKITSTKIYEIYNSDNESIQELKSRTAPFILKGLKHRKKREWDKALCCFQEALDLFPEDLAIKQHLEYCLMLKDNPPSFEWDGAINLDIDPLKSWMDYRQKVQWKDSYSIGDDEVDNQHKELFNLVNNLIEATVFGGVKKEIEKAINFLEEYVVLHFKSEEDLMSATHYPDYHIHKDIHDNFIDEVLILKKEFNNSGINLELAFKVQTNVVNWLLTHIMEEDQKIGDWINNTP